MTDHDHQSAHNLFDIVGGEKIDDTTTAGGQYSVAALPVPDGTVRVALALHTPAGPLMLGMAITPDQVRAIADLLTRVAAR